MDAVGLLPPEILEVIIETIILLVKKNYLPFDWELIFISLVLVH